MAQEQRGDLGQVDDAAAADGDHHVGASSRPWATAASMAVMGTSTAARVEDGHVDAGVLERRADRVEALRRADHRIGADHGSAPVARGDGPRGRGHPRSEQDLGRRAQHGEVRHGLQEGRHKAAELVGAFDRRGVPAPAEDVQARVGQPAQQRRARCRAGGRPRPRLRGRAAPAR
jgi:hypothetical protein